MRVDHHERVVARVTASASASASARGTCTPRSGTRTRTRRRRDNTTKSDQERCVPLGVPGQFSVAIEKFPDGERLEATGIVRYAQAVRVRLRFHVHRAVAPRLEPTLPVPLPMAEFLVGGRWWWSVVVVVSVVLVVLVVVVVVRRFARVRSCE